jgi:DNA-binding beta-propeller fold protein YncE
MHLRRFAAPAPTALAALALAIATAASRQSLTYHVLNRYVLGGDGGWDYLALDTAHHRLFIARQDRIMVVDPARGTLLGEIPGLERAHGIAFTYEAGHGFATSGGDSTVVMFDLRTLQVLGRTTAATDDDAILYDPASRRVFTFNGDAGSSTVIDPVSGRRLGTIALGGKPEFAVSAGDGRLYVNIEDRGAVAELDARAMKVTRHWSIAPCESPTGLAIDRVHRRLFSVCRSKVMAISDARAGKLIATVPIGSGPDGAAFDPATGCAFSSNGDGTLTVVHEDSPNAFRVLQTVPTMPGARTMTLDPVTHRVYLVSARFGGAPTPAARSGPAAGAAAAAAPRRRPPMVPGSFTLLVLGP